MTYTTITIKSALDQINQRRMVLPSIQREFVWSPDQVERLFDSLLQGYPIGSLLGWQVLKENSLHYKLYEFMTDYSELDNRYCRPLTLPVEHDLTAILDGQQRLTSLNLGFVGSYASRLKYKWARSSASYPKRRLFLDLLYEPSQDEDDRKQFGFTFIRTDSDSVSDPRLFDVSTIRTMEEPGDVYKTLLSRELASEERAFRALSSLRELYHERPVINVFREDNQDLDRVLNIFIRLNRGGTPLSYSDMLLSTATAHWGKEEDARKAVQEAVSSMNNAGRGFNFSKDLVLKAGLVCTNAPDIQFKVTSFKREQTLRLRDEWDAIASALERTARLLASFGLSGDTLSAASVAIPVAYYLFNHPAPAIVVSGGAETAKADRAAVREWTFRSLVKSGIWGSGLDTLLREVKSAMDGAPRDRFPVEPIEAAMARRGKALVFSKAELDAVIDTPYGKGRVYPLLALLYPHAVGPNGCDIDHVYPQTRMRPSKLQKLGLSSEVADDTAAKANLLANLQLLTPEEHASKLSELPKSWLESRIPSPDERQAWALSRDLAGLTEDERDFLQFYEGRRTLMLARLEQRLGTSVVDQIPEAQVEELFDDDEEEVLAAAS